MDIHPLKEFSQSNEFHDGSAKAQLSKKPFSSSAAAGLVKGGLTKYLPRLQAGQDRLLWRVWGSEDIPRLFKLETEARISTDACYSFWPFASVLGAIMLPEAYKFSNPLQRLNPTAEEHTDDFSLNEKCWRTVALDWQEEVQTPT
jgi:hypothetical protein